MTYDDEIRLTELIGSLQTLLLSTTDMKTFLEGVTVVAGSVVDPPASCGITTVVDGRPTSVATSDPRAAALDEAQYAYGSGPCLEAIETGAPVEVADQAADERWAEYGARAAEIGLRSSLSIPMRTADGRTLGAVNVYGYDRPREFGPEERERLESFADQAAVALALALQREDLHRLTAQLEQALVSRSVIDQAIGVLMAEERCDAQAAFDLLRQHSQNHNRKLRDVAADFLTRFTGHRPADGVGRDVPDDLAPA
ncbi:transcription antitermination regulator [Nocardioides silvaticus]|uniref:Transcription antitermination regulator n=1 Tax=Nocardioides silvaticus TaxID=2201891 RepID=A0A316TFE8_9ACTN|nr:GAF and ANTAR domain-containing protein [Nocardioides silvaticus]PWN02161.1 transcription antitermination regulator [Nocardioides silvaticus]